MYQSDLDYERKRKHYLWPVMKRGQILREGVTEIFVRRKAQSYSWLWADEGSAKQGFSHTL